MEFSAPFPYFGGKRLIAPEVWQRLGDITHYVEPFCGSAAVLLARPGWRDPCPWIETVNDKDGLICNFWRAVQATPETVAGWADWPLNENDLHARHAWLVGQKESLQARLEGDPHYYDAQIAGWWVWGMAGWIGSEFCSGKGPWAVVDGELVRHAIDQGIKRKLVHLGDSGQGIQRKLVHFGDSGQGIHRQLVHLGGSGTGRQGLVAWMQALQARLRSVDVACGDWQRIVTPAVLFRVRDQAPVGVFLDPPYAASTKRDPNLYRMESGDVAVSCLAWAIQHGDDPRLRIVLCGYDEHDALVKHGWEALSWSAQGGYGLQGDGAGKENRHRETLWFSPHCIPVSRQEVLPFGGHGR